MAAPIPNLVPLPPLNLGPQPNIGNLQLLQQQQQQLAAILNQLQLLTNAVNDNQASINRIPMQLYNATTSAEAPLLYPSGIVPGPPLPLTKKELRTISAANCNASLAHLGLPPVAVGVPIAQHRQVLMDYLGSGMRA